MEGQSVPCEPLGQYLQDLLGILTVLEAQHSIVGVADYKHLAPEARLHVALDPFIEYKMKVYVGQERADYLALPRPRLAHQQPSVVDDSYVDPLPYQSEDACIAYPPLNHLHELFSHDGVEVGGDVQLKDTRDRLAPHDPVDLVQRVLCTTSRTEPVGAIQKILLIDGCEQLYRCLLHNLVFQGGNRDRPLLPILFWNVDPAQWLCSICFILQPSMQLLDFLLCLLLVVHIRDAVHPGAGVPSQHQECLLQRFRCEKVSDREEFTSWICLRQFSYSTESHLTYFPSSMSRVCGAP